MTIRPLGGQPRLAYRPPGGWPPSVRIWWFQLLLISNTIFLHCPPDHGIHPDAGDSPVNMTARPVWQGVWQGVWPVWQGVPLK
jgi:hypothetical protein